MPGDHPVPDASHSHSLFFEEHMDPASLARGCACFIPFPPGTGLGQAGGQMNTSTGVGASNPVGDSMIRAGGSCENGNSGWGRGAE